MARKKRVGTGFCDSPAKRVNTAMLSEETVRQLAFHIDLLSTRFVKYHAFVLLLKGCMEAAANQQAGDADIRDVATISLSSSSSPLSLAS